MKRTIVLSALLLLTFGTVYASQLDLLHEGVSRLNAMALSRDGSGPEPCAVSGPPLPHACGPGVVLQRLEPQLRKPYLPDDIIIQDTVLIQSDTTIYDNIVLLGSGLLIVENCAFSLKGDLTALENSRFSVDSANFTILQDHIYQYILVAGDSAQIEIKGSEFSTSRFPAACAAAGRGSVSMNTVDMVDGFLTFVLMEGGSMDINQSDRAGEFVVLGDSAQLEIAQSDTVLVWLGFPPGSSGEVHGSPGMDDWVEQFIFPDSTCLGINYSIQVDSLYALILATMAEDSTDVTVYDAALQSAGNIFWTPFTDTISGLVDNTLYTDWTAPFPGRTLRLVNTSITAWNLYFNNNTEFTLTSSIFGECQTSDSARTTIMNAVCDGSGGHIETNGSAFLLSFLNSFFTDALLQKHTTSVFYLSNFVTGAIIGKDLATAITYNTVMVNPIQVYDSATVMVAGLYPPSPAYINDTLSIQGSARMVKAPYSPFQFDGYRLEYAPREDTTVYFPLTDRITEPVDDDELCEFVTVGLDVGNYIIRLWYFLSAYTSHDSLPFVNSIYLTYKTGVQEVHGSPGFSLEILPLCASKGASIQYSIPAEGPVDLRVYDASGRRVAVLDRGFRQPGDYAAEWDAGTHPGGVYFVRLSAGGKLLTRKLVTLN